MLGPLAQKPVIGSAVGAVLRHADVLGVLGVEVFFVLSGFLIGGILIREYVEQPVFGWDVLVNFWKRRWYRTLPIYWLVLTVDICLFAAIGLQPMEWYKLLFYGFLQNLWYPNPRWFFGEAWSLSVEEWFYITLPLVLYVVARLKPAKERMVQLVRTALGYLVVIAIVRFAYAYAAGADVEQDEGIRKVVLLRLDAVLYGVLMAAWQYMQPKQVYKWRWPLLLVAVVGYVGWYAAMSSEAWQLTNAQLPQVRLLSNAFLYVLLPATFALCLPYANSMVGASGVIANVVRNVSKISYAMYLVHFSLVYIPFFSRWQVVGTLPIVGQYLLYWVIVIGISSLLYKYVEQPVMRYRDRVTRG